MAHEWSYTKSSIKHQPQLELVLLHSRAIYGAWLEQTYQPQMGQLSEI